MVRTICIMSSEVWGIECTLKTEDGRVVARRTQQWFFVDTLRDGVYEVCSEMSRLYADEVLLKGSLVKEDRGVSSYIVRRA